MDAATVTTVLHHHPSLALPVSVSVPVPVPQPHPHAPADAHANARAYSHAPSHAHAPRGHVHANAGNSDQSLDAVRNAWHFPPADAMLAYDDTEEHEEHESDVSRLQGDESARSSSVTTPDLPMSRPPPPPPLGSKHGQIFDSSLKAPIPPPPPDYQSHRQRSSSLSPAHPPNISLFPSSRTSNVSRHQPPPPPPPPPPPRSNDPPRLSYPPGLPPPPPPPVSRSDHDTPRASEAMFSVLPPPPPPPPLRPRSPISSEDRDHDTEFPRQHPGYPRPSGPLNMAKLSKVPSIPPSDGKSLPSRRRRPRGRPRRRSSHHSSGSSTYSRTRPSVTPQSDSGSSSEEDPILYRNARQFPPLLPTAPAFGSPGTDTKASVTKHITSWVAQYERTQSPPRQPPVETEASTPSRGGGLFNTGNDAEYGSGGSDASSEGEIEMLWTQLKEKREKLNRMKNEMAKRRKELRDLRRRKDDADNAFMSVIRPMLISQRGAMHTPPNLLDRRLNDMQSLRTDYHFLEANYEGLEVMLDEEEAELNSLETRFFSLLAAGRTRLERPQAEVDSELDRIDYFQSMPVDLKGISPNGPPEDLHPLYVELMSTVGDLENAKEDYEDLLFIKEQYDYDLEMKRTTGMGGGEEEDVAEFCAEFPGEQQRMLGNVSKLEGAVDRLKHVCESQGVMRRHMSPRVEYLLYPEREYEDMDLDETDTILEQRHNLAHDKFPVLLTQPDHILVPQTSLDALKAAATLLDNDVEKRGKMQLASKEYAIDKLIMDHENGGKADFVNRWLLQQLRTSSMNAALLHSTFMNSRSLKIKDFWRWQSDVLHYWWRDGTAALAEDSYKMVTSEGSQYASRVGTTQLSRAASDGIPKRRNRRHHFTNNSEAHTTIA
ncbi:hypothetical protein G7Z17_g11362 [Cylindrodendrum hubeiense]|uniref:Uncharacterized protein n=1 Tax=Cylindrodendrum hubeiense TaxID=595255 RepID=A0A9P5GW12_9HYPO|nr:hypothetical protein G7Z17_g11362 [Cylindrodendrum hubeiense]